MKKQDLEALLVFSDSWRPGNAQYITDYRAFNNTIFDFPRYVPCVLVSLMTEGEPVLFASRQTLLEAKEKSWVQDVRQFADLETYLTQLKGHVKSRKIGIEGREIMPAIMYESLAKWLSDFALVPVNTITTLRVTKSKKELEYMQKAAEIVEDGMRAAIETMKEGAQEKEIARAAEIEMLSKGAEGSGFDTLVMSGPHSAFTICRPTDRRLEKGDLILIDLSAKYKGYCSDLARGIAFGQVSEEKKKILQVCVAASAKGRQILKPGMTTTDLDEAVGAVFEQAGYGKYRIQGGFHGIGIEFGEPLGRDVLLQPNMTLVVVSAVPVPGVGGARIEDDVVVTEKGMRHLTNFEREIFL